MFMCFIFKNIEIMKKIVKINIYKSPKSAILYAGENKAKTAFFDEPFN